MFQSNDFFLHYRQPNLLLTNGQEKVIKIHKKVCVNIIFQMGIKQCPYTPFVAISRQVK